MIIHVVNIYSTSTVQPRYGRSHQFTRELLGHVCEYASNQIRKTLQKQCTREINLTKRLRND